MADLIDAQWLKENLTKEYMASRIDPYTTGRKFLPIAHRLGTQMLRAIFKRIIDLVMESNRVKISRDCYLYIGVLGTLKTHDCLHTDGKRYGLKLTGMKHNSHFRMPFRRRKELATRLRNGQKFLT